MIKANKYLKETITEILEELHSIYSIKVVNVKKEHLDELVSVYKDICCNRREYSKKHALNRLNHLITYLKGVDRCAKIENTGYLIDDNGNCFSIKSGKTLKKRCRGRVRKYDSLMLYNNSGAGSSFATHRLVATYFVVNTDPLNNIIVNHIDNNPLNNHFSNLEWCTASYNTQHSYDTKNRTNVTKTVYLTNLKTSELLIFDSVELAADFLGVDKSTVSHYIIKDRSNKEYIIEHYENIKTISRINEKYKNILSEIVKKGFTYEDPNRTGVYRKQIPTYTFSHYFKSEGFPILTLRKSFIESAFQEMKLFLSGESNLKIFKSKGVNFWDKDAYNFAVKQGYIGTFDSFIDFAKNNDFSLGKIYPHHIRNYNGVTDQLKDLIHILKTNPFATKKNNYNVESIR